MIIGISGVPGSGKDEISKWLCLQHGYFRVALADCIREELYILNPHVLAMGGFVQLQSLVDNLGWDAAKRCSPDVRGLLQRYGSEIGRDRNGEDTWLDKAWSKMGDMEKVVIPDIRFMNEVERIQEQGQLWYVDRPKKRPVNNHVSESFYFEIRDRADAVFCNDGRLLDLCEKVDAYLS